MNYFLIALLHFINPHSIDQSEALTHNIILVQGEPKLVTMTPYGDVIQSYNISRDYFSSQESHEDLVAIEVEKTSDLINTRFITVDYNQDGLSEAAIDNIRYITVLAEQNENSDIQITISDDDFSESISSDLFNIIEGFGIDRSRIQLMSKTYLGSNQFIKISLDI